MSVPLGPTAAGWWARARVPLLLALVTLTVVSGLVLIRGERHAGLLDPRATDPRGSRALARLLEDRGVPVDRVTSAEDASRTAAASRATLVVPFPDRLTEEALHTLAATDAGRTVLIAPGERALAVLVPDLHTRTGTDPRVVDPACPDPVAERAGNALLGGVRYDLDRLPVALGCYPVDGRPTLVVVPADGDRDTVVLGTGDSLRNEFLDEHGNASLALQLLGARSRVVWYLPGDATADGDRSLWGLLPAGWRFGLVQLGVGAVLLALWRARRLGPVVSEPLPVVVRATETVEGRARLYRRARARDRAAALLRDAAISRLAATLGVFGPGPALIDAVAAHTGRPAAEVHALLYGAVPGDDDALVALADDLDALERRVRGT